MSEKKVCVSEQFIKQLQERNMKLEQKLETAKADGVMEAISNAELAKWLVAASDVYPEAELESWKVGVQDCRLSLIEYANNLEGK